MGKARGTGTKKVQSFQPAAGKKRIVSLGGGTWAYVTDAANKTHHVKRDSDEFVNLVQHLNEEFGGLGDLELERLGWS